MKLCGEDTRGSTGWAETKPGQGHPEGLSITSHRPQGVILSNVAFTAPAAVHTMDLGPISKPMLLELSRTLRGDAGATVVSLGARVAVLVDR